MQTLAPSCDIARPPAASRTLQRAIQKSGRNKLRVLRTLDLHFLDGTYLQQCDDGAIQLPRRPLQLALETIDLIRQMAKENRLSGQNAFGVSGHPPGALPEVHAQGASKLKSDLGHFLEESRR
jgi:hypothetical protein